MLRPLRLFRELSVALVRFLLDILEYIFLKISEWINHKSFSLGMPDDPNYVNYDRKEFYWTKFFYTQPDLDSVLESPRFKPLLFLGQANVEIDDFRKVFLPFPGLADVPGIAKVFWWEDGKEFVKDYGYQAFYIMPIRSMGLLPDWIAAKINLLVAYNDFLNVNELDEIRQTIVLGMFYYQFLYSVRVSLEFTFISLNPYAAIPTTLLWAMFDWIDQYLGTAFPVFIGLPWAGPVFFGMLNSLRNKILRLLITTPYLPSEALIGEVRTKDGLEEVLYFKGLPTQWVKYGIPNEERLDWYFNRPHVLEYMYKTFGEDIFKLVPDYIPDHFLNGHL